MKELGYLLLVFLLVGYLSCFSRLPSIHYDNYDLQYYFLLRKKYLDIHLTNVVFLYFFSSFVRKQFIMQSRQY